MPDVLAALPGAKRLQGSHDLAHADARVGAKSLAPRRLHPDGLCQRGHLLEGSLGRYRLHCYGLTGRHKV